MKKAKMFPLGGVALLTAAALVIGACVDPPEDSAAGPLDFIEDPVVEPTSDGEGLSVDNPDGPEAPPASGTELDTVDTPGGQHTTGGEAARTPSSSRAGEASPVPEGTPGEAPPLPEGIPGGGGEPGPDADETVEFVNPDLDAPPTKGGGVELDVIDTPGGQRTVSPHDNGGAPNGNSEPVEDIPPAPNA